MFAWMLYVAIPLALFRLYVTRVSNTVDGTTIPLRNAPGVAVLYFILGLLSIVLVCLVLIWKRKYFSAGSAVLVVSVVAIFGFPMLDKTLLNPEQGSSVAYRNTDAAIIAASACRSFCERTSAWPRSWDDLRSDLESSAAALNAIRLTEVNADPNRPKKQLTFDEIRKCVDINFTSDPSVFVTQDWSSFTGIVPQRPCYNLYREQFSKLIEELSNMRR